MVEEMYSIPASTWRKWRSQMDDLASAENHDARTSTIMMERVDELEALLQQHSSSVSPTTQHANDGDHPSQPTNTAQINHNAPTTCDASTQLYTIREASLSKHIFRRIRDNLTARRCAHLVGRLGAQVLTLTEDLLRVFSMTLTHTDSLYNLTVAARMLSAATGGVAEEPHIFCNSDEVEAQPSSSRSHDDGAAPGTSRYQAELEAIDHAAAKFAPYVYALQEDTLRALCSQLPSWRSIYVRSLEVEEAAQELYYARQGHLLNSFAEWIAAQPPIHVNESVQVDACEEKPIFMPFLCRNCRQDGRANYNYNAGKRRLSSVETAVAGAQFTGRSVETMTGSSAADPLGPQDSSRWHNRRAISYAAMPTEKPSPSGVSYAEEEKFRLARNPSSAQLERLAPNIRYLKGVLPSEKGGAPTGKSTGVGLPALPHHRQRLS